MSVAVEQAGIDYHVVLAQNALQQCLDQPELQSELICALVKQTSRHTQQRLGVQVKKAARLVSLGTARVVSPAYCLTNTLHQYAIFSISPSIHRPFKLSKKNLKSVPTNLNGQRNSKRDHRHFEIVNHKMAYWKMLGQVFEVKFCWQTICLYLSQCIFSINFSCTICN